MITDERGQRIGNQVIDMKRPGQSLTDDSQDGVCASTCSVAAVTQSPAGSTQYPYP
jgi:hypothetical protein